MLPAELTWLVISLLIGSTVLMCLKTIGAHLQYGLDIHNLRIEAHRIRREHNRQLQAMREESDSAKRNMRRRRMKVPDDQLTGVEVLDDDEATAATAEVAADATEPPLAQAA